LQITFAWDVISESTSKEDVLPAISVLATILFILGVGWFMSYMVKLEEQKIAKSNCGGSGAAGGDGSASAAAGAGGAAARVEPQLKIHELRGETYNGLVRLLKPGCRTIVLILDNESKRTLLPKFHRTAWPYRLVCLGLDYGCVDGQFVKFVTLLGNSKP
jgi:DnaJ family protein C protein 16